MPINALLVRWNGGWREIRSDWSIGIYGRREALLGLGALNDPAEVDRCGLMQLAIYHDHRSEISADHDPNSPLDRPYRAYNVGDVITVPDYGGATTVSERVKAIAGAEDDNGEVTYSPTLGDIILEEQERMLQSIKKMADGTLEGDSAIATPVSYVAINKKIYGTAPMPPGGAG